MDIISLKKNYKTTMCLTTKMFFRPGTMIKYSLSRKYHLQYYLCLQNTRLQKVNSTFGAFASLAPGTF